MTVGGVFIAGKHKPLNIREMSSKKVDTATVEKEVTFIEQEFEKVAKNNNLPNTNFNWNDTNRPFEIFTLYSDKTPTTSSSNTIIFK